MDFFVHGVDDMLQLLDELFSVCVLIENVNRCARLIGLGVLLILTMGRQSSEPSKLQTQAAYRLAEQFLSTPAAAASECIV